MNSQKFVLCHFSQEIYRRKIQQENSVWDTGKTGKAANIASGEGRRGGVPRALVQKNLQLGWKDN